MAQRFTYTSRYGTRLIASAVTKTKTVVMIHPTQGDGLSVLLTNRAARELRDMLDRRLGA